MAFFKFRLPGFAGRTEVPAPAGRRGTTESIDALRRRARHRLVGAAVLVALGVIGFPLLFDTQPRPVAVDIPIEIPDRNKAAPLTLPAASQPPVPAVAEAAPRPAAPADTRIADAAGLGVGEEMVPPAKIEPKVPLASVPPAQSAIKKEAKPDPKGVARPDPKPDSRLDEAARARALLEGQPLPAASAAPAKPADADTGRFIVQVGAFSEADKALEVRQKAERAGLKTYTQVVETKDGKRTRVRVGPYTSRAEADKAAARLKAAELPASILAL